MHNLVFSLNNLDCIGKKPVWEIIDTGIKSARENMELDAKFLEELDPNGSPILHFYGWEKQSGTYGYFLNPNQFLDLKMCQSEGIELARRPTGGGIIFHFSDLAFSVLIPASHPEFSSNTLENYNFINNGVKRALQIFFKNANIPFLLPEEPIPFNEKCRHFCMAKPTKYDVMIGGRKIAGAAQRKQKQGYLHQGTIAIGLPKQTFIDSILLPETKVFEAMQQNTFSILGTDWAPSDLTRVRAELRNLLTYSFTGE